MSRYHSYINSAQQILNEYGGKQPFSSFLKQYFSAKKKFGSKDRKQIGHLCYCYFRLGKAFPEESIEDRILLGLFLCSDHPDEVLEQLKPGWNDKIHLPPGEKLSSINYPFSIEEVFPWKNELSDEIDHETFCESFFIQPDLFIRLRPGYENQVKTKLQAEGIKFSGISSTCLALPNAAKIDNIIELDKEAVVQDYTSQQTAGFLRDLKFQSSDQTSKVWDCCAGSGGKSLLIHDIDPDIELTVSDVRVSILFNLKKRFAKAGIKNYKSFSADLTKPNFSSEVLGDKSPFSAQVRQESSGKSFQTSFDLIICDAPCTGSGTWGRTPQQLCFFDEKKIDQYSLLQKKIASNIVSSLKANGWLFYITCSVFKKENEQVVEVIRNNSGLELIKMELLKGYNKKADTMFAALFNKKS